MAEHLILADPQSARDALTFAGRAKQVGDEAVRLQASRGTLAMYAAALTPRGLFDGTPLILVLRVLRADPELECDLTVDSLTETIDPRALRLPDLAVARSWAAVDVPRGGWTRTEEIPATVIRELAQAGNSDVAKALPLNPGQDVVSKVRSRVWGEQAEELAQLPKGVAFAAATFGFLGQSSERASVWRAGRWTRVSLSRGHVLYRGPVAVGLTEVRRTGSHRRRAHGVLSPMMPHRVSIH